MSGENGWLTIGTTVEEKGEDIQNLKINQPAIFVVGNEAEGITFNTLRRCNRTVHIRSFAPVSDRKSLIDRNLNVSVATGTLLYHGHTKQSYEPIVLADVPEVVAE